jgi:hypothetical protein
MQPPRKKAVLESEMPQRGGARRKGSYGIDAPYLLPILGVLIVANVVQGLVSRSAWP